MFIGKDENQYAVYMLSDRKTGAAYIGSSTDVAKRLQAHEISIRKRTGKCATQKRILKAFPDVESVEFRIIEFIPLVKDADYPEETGWYRIDDSCNVALRDREAYWIRTLKPSVNLQVRKAKVCIEDLPYGEPEPHATGRAKPVTSPR